MKKQYLMPIFIIMCLIITSCKTSNNHDKSIVELVLKLHIFDI